jgi:hypothetical protein
MPRCWGATGLWIELHVPVPWLCARLGRARLPKLNYVVQSEEDIGDAEIEVRTPTHTHSAHMHSVQARMHATA